MAKPPFMRSSHPTQRPPNLSGRHELYMNGVHRHVLPPASIHQFSPNGSNFAGIPLAISENPQRLAIHDPSSLMREATGYPSVLTNELIPARRTSIPSVVSSVPGLPQAPPVVDPMRGALCRSFQERALVLREVAAINALLSPQAPLLNIHGGGLTPGNIPLASTLFQRPAPSDREALMMTLATEARAAELAAEDAMRGYEFAAHQIQLNIASATKMPIPHGNAVSEKKSSDDLEAAQACLALGQKKESETKPPEAKIADETKTKMTEINLPISEPSKKRKRTDPEGSVEAPKRIASDRKKSKRPVDAPRRPLSAYNFFFSEEREKILESLPSPEGEGGNTSDSKNSPNSISSAFKQVDSSDPSVVYEAIISQRLSHAKKRRRHRKTHGKIGFKDLAKLIGERWRDLPTDRVAYYKQLAEMDLARYKVAMEEYGRKSLGKKKLEDLDEESS